MDTSIYTPVILNTELIFNVSSRVPRERTASGDECEHRQCARTLPMTNTNISMVAKTVGPGASPPSTTAGPTGDTVLSEAAFDAPEVREAVGPVGPKARQARARIGGMSCDELVNLFEDNGADGGSLESVLSGGATGAEFKLMLVSAGAA